MLLPPFRCAGWANRCTVKYSPQLAQDTQKNRSKKKRCRSIHLVYQTEKQLFKSDSPLSSIVVICILQLQ
jgi:hypothetical protein